MLLTKVQWQQVIEEYQEGKQKTAIKGFKPDGPYLVDIARRIAPRRDDAVVEWDPPGRGNESVALDKLCQRIGIRRDWRAGEDVLHGLGQRRVEIERMAGYVRETAERMLAHRRVREADEDGDIGQAVRQVLQHMEAAVLAIGEAERIAGERGV